MEDMLGQLRKLEGVDEDGADEAKTEQCDGLDADDTITSEVASHVSEDSEPPNDRYVILRTLWKQRENFWRNYRTKLYRESEDIEMYNQILSQLRCIENKLEEGKVALVHLEMHLINVACDDPGIGD